MRPDLDLLNLVTDYDDDHARLHARFDYFDGVVIRDLVTREVLYEGEEPDDALALIAERYPSVDGDGSLAEALAALGVDVLEEEEPCAPVAALSPCQRAIRGWV